MLQCVFRKYLQEKSVQNLDGQWLDSQYQNSKLVPNMAEYVAKWISDSEAAREVPDCKLDISYGDSPRQKLDIFPASEPDAPVLIFIHGGFWRAMSKSESSFVGPAFTSHGVCVVVPDYDLCPGTKDKPITISDITMQMVKAVAWVHKNIRKYGGNPKRITVAGHSAGGHLTSMLATCNWSAYDRSLPDNVMRNGLAISPLNDLIPIKYTPFIADLNISEEESLRASPAFLPKPKNMVLFSVVGAKESDEFIRQNTLTQKAWGTDVVPVCEALPGHNHFSILTALTTHGDPLHHYALDLLKS